MSRPPADSVTPRFSVEHGSRPGDVPIVGLSSFGLAGLTAVDYPVDDLGVDAAPLEAFGAEIRRRYEALTERTRDREPEGGHDRMST